MESLESTVSLFSLLGDTTRVRLLALLSREELTVAELTAVTELSQSRVSTHLGRLRDGGLLRDHQVGTSRFYSLNEGAMPPQARKVLAMIQERVDDAVLRGDMRRCTSVLRSREGTTWPDSIAGELERHYSPGRTWEATARGLLGFVELGDVLDVGAGDGATAQLLLPRARTFTCVDSSQRMITAAKRRLSQAQNVMFSVADMHQLPFDPASFDQVLLFNSLTYSEHPSLAVAEAARVLRPGGTLVAITLSAHQHPEITQAYSHQNSGFSPERLRPLLESGPLHVEFCELTSRERRKPYFEMVTAVANKANIRPKRK